MKKISNLWKLIISKFWNISNPLYSTTSHVRWEFLPVIDAAGYIKKLDEIKVLLTSQLKHSNWGREEVPDHEKQWDLPSG